MKMGGIRQAMACPDDKRRFHGRIVRPAQSWCCRATVKRAAGRSGQAGRMACLPQWPCHHASRLIAPRRMSSCLPHPTDGFGLRGCVSERWRGLNGLRCRL